MPSLNPNSYIRGTSKQAFITPSFSGVSATRRRRLYQSHAKTVLTKQPLTALIDIDNVYCLCPLLSRNQLLFCGNIAHRFEKGTMQYLRFFAIPTILSNSKTMRSNLPPICRCSYPRAFLSLGSTKLVQTVAGVRKVSIRFWGQSESEQSGIA